MIIKCKMCGGDLNIQEGNPICECEFCGTQQTVPIVDNEKKVNLFNRANRLRMNAEFDKATTVYASITAEFPEEAEAYWGLCLCKYGIEYVDDPKTGNKIPTCHRTLPESIMDDTDFDQACEYADPVAKRLYREEAKEIDRIQQSILSIVANEEPYDVFICYKETDDNGERTVDSVLAQDIYDALTGKSLKVFFARITLEDKLGQEYEPYIYAALHSAKVMLAIGTKFEYYDAVWVKNEWARFLNMMKSDRSKTLIPCYKDLDAYDMPKEFKNLQAQDMAKLGWLQDLTRGVMKLCGKDERQQMTQVAVATDSSGIRPLLKRIQMFMKDEEWVKANEYVERVLDKDPECGEAYLYRVLIKCGIADEEQLKKSAFKLTDDKDLQRAREFSDGELRERIDEISIATETNCVRSDLYAVLNQYYQERSKEEEKRQRIEAENKKKLDEVNSLIQEATTIDVINYINEKLLELGDYEGAKEAKDQAARKLEKIKNEKQKEEEAKAKIQQMISKHEEEKKPVLESLQKSLDEENIHIKDVQSKLMKSKEDLASLKGLFVAKKRSELENTISQYEQDLKQTEERIKQIEQEISRENTSLYEANEKDLQYIYDLGKTYLDAGMVKDAFNIFLRTRQHQEFEELIHTDERFKNMLTNFRSVGKTVQFGRYKQTREGQNGSDWIDWVVKAVEDGNKCLLVCASGLDTKPYHEKKQWVQWSTCSMRNWLNNEFLDSSFSKEEKDTILTTNVINADEEGNPVYVNTPGQNTNDKVFLLSYYEAVMMYFTIDYCRTCSPTEYALSTGAFGARDGKTGKMNGRWWLRSPGSGHDHAAYINENGICRTAEVTNDMITIRPAIWLNLDSNLLKL